MAVVDPEPASFAEVRSEAARWIAHQTWFGFSPVLYAVIGCAVLAVVGWLDRRRRLRDAGVDQRATRQASALELVAAYLIVAGGIRGSFGAHVHTEGLPRPLALQLTFVAVATLVTFVFLRPASKMTGSLRLRVATIAPVFVLALVSISVRLPVPAAIVVAASSIAALVVRDDVLARRGTRGRPRAQRIEVAVRSLSNFKRPPVVVIGDEFVIHLGANVFEVPAASEHGTDDVVAATARWVSIWPDAPWFARIGALPASSWALIYFVIGMGFTDHLASGFGPLVLFGGAMVRLVTGVLGRRWARERTRRRAPECIDDPAQLGPLAQRAGRMTKGLSAYVLILVLAVMVIIGPLRMPYRSTIRLLGPAVILVRAVEAEVRDDDPRLAAGLGLLIAEVPGNRAAGYGSAAHGFELLDDCGSAAAAMELSRSWGDETDLRAAWFARIELRCATAVAAVRERSSSGQVATLRGRVPEVPGPV